MDRMAYGLSGIFGKGTGRCSEQGTLSFYWGTSAATEADGYRQARWTAARVIEKEKSSEFGEAMRMVSQKAVCLL